MFPLALWKSGTRSGEDWLLWMTALPWTYHPQKVMAVAMTGALKTVQGGGSGRDNFCSENPGGLREKAVREGRAAFRLIGQGPQLLFLSLQKPWSLKMTSAPGLTGKGTVEGGTGSQYFLL